MFAAFAPVSGAFYVDDEECEEPDTVDIPCTPGRTNIPMIEFHGGADETIRYAGAPRRGICVPSILHWVQQWAERNGLEQPQNTSSVVGDDATLFEFESALGEDLGLVSHVFDPNVAHSWPSTVSCRL